MGRVGEGMVTGRSRNKNADFAAKNSIVVPGPIYRKEKCNFLVKISHKDRGLGEKIDLIHPKNS